MRLIVWCAQKATSAGQVRPNCTIRALRRLEVIWELKKSGFRPKTKRIKARKNPHPNETLFCFNLLRFRPF